MRCRMCAVRSDVIRKTTVLTVGAVSFLSCILPLMAARVLPPLQALRHPNITLVVVERPDAPVIDHRMAVRVVERLRGDPDVPDETELLVAKGDEKAVEPGHKYLLFYSDVERVSFKPGKEVRRPDRRLLLHIDGADPAVFPDTPEMRALLDPEHAEIEQDPRYRAVVMEGLHSNDPAMVDLWSAEWEFRPATFAEVRASEVELLRGIVENPAQRPFARARILLTAARRTPASLGPWYATSAGVVLEEIRPAQLPENTGLSQLVYASLSVAENNPHLAEAHKLEKWLRATPPLAEKAALALRAIDPELEREAVRRAIADEQIPARTRTFLSEHLERLELAGSRSQ